MAKSKLHVGIMFITERDTSADAVPKFRVMGNYELLLLDGREIDPKRYPRLSVLLQNSGHGNKLPNEYQQEDIQDCYIVARRMQAEEIRFMKDLRKQKGGDKK